MEKSVRHFRMMQPLKFEDFGSFLSKIVTGIPFLINCNPMQTP